MWAVQLISGSIELLKIEQFSKEVGVEVSLGEAAVEDGKANGPSVQSVNVLFEIGWIC